MEWEPLVTLLVFGASVAVVVAAIVLSLWGLPDRRTSRAPRPEAQEDRPEPRGVVVQFRPRPRNRTARR